MTFGSHGGQAFWTGVLKTGTTGSLYNTLGIIPYVVTMQTATVPAVPAVTKQVPVYGTRGVYAKDKKGKWQPVMIKVNGKMVQKTEQYVVKYNTVIVTPAKAAIPGATGTFNSAFNPNSILTLNAVPTVFK
jgi:hypothetical protein